MILVVISIMLIITGTLYKIFPAKEINKMYGYRTSRATKSQVAWNEAQKAAGNGFIVAGLLNFVLGKVIEWKMNSLPWNWQLLIAFIIIFISLLKVDFYMRKTFDAKGDYRNKPL